MSCCMYSAAQHLCRPNDPWDDDGDDYDGGNDDRNDDVMYDGGEIRDLLKDLFLWKYLTLLTYEMRVS